MIIVSIYVRQKSNTVIFYDAINVCMIMLVWVCIFGLCVNLYVCLCVWVCVCVWVSLCVCLCDLNVITSSWYHIDTYPRVFPNQFSATQIHQWNVVHHWTWDVSMVTHLKLPLLIEWMMIGTFSIRPINAFIWAKNQKSSFAETAWLHFPEYHQSKWEIIVIQLPFDNLF